MFLEHSHQPQYQGYTDQVLESMSFHAYPVFWWFTNHGDYVMSQETSTALLNSFYEIDKAPHKEDESDDEVIYGDTEKVGETRICIGERLRKLGFFSKIVNSYLLLNLVEDLVGCSAEESTPPIHRFTGSFKKNSGGNNSVWLGLGIGFGCLFIFLGLVFFYLWHKNRQIAAAGELEMAQQTLARRAFVESFPARVYSASDDGTDELCAICIEAFEPGSNLMLLPLCGHVFHRECIFSFWERVTSKTECPMCRHDNDTWHPDEEHV